MPATPSSDADVLFSLTGDVRRNSRALRQLRTLGEMGLSVQVLTFGTGEPLPAEWGTIHLHELKEPPGQGPIFFYRVHRLFRDVARKIRSKIYHASDLYTLPAMEAAARVHGGHVVYDARELYPHVGAIAGKPLSRWFWYKLERHYSRRADAVFTVSQPIADWMAAHYSIEPPTLLQNVPLRRNVLRTDQLRRQTGATPGQVIILYQGYLKPGRGCELLLRAVRDVPEAVLVFLGEGPLQPALEADAQSQGLSSRVHFLPMVPPGELLSVTASADIGACLIEDRSLSLHYSLPNKLFEYLAAGLPVLASNLPEIRRVVETFDVGLTVDPNDHEALVEALVSMLRDEEGRRRWSANTPAVFETFNWETISERFKSVYRGLLSST